MDDSAGDGVQETHTGKDEADHVDAYRKYDNVLLDHEISLLTELERSRKLRDLV